MPAYEDKDGRWLTVADVVERWGCGNKAVLDLIHREQLAASRAGHAYRVELAEVERYEREQGKPRRARQATPEQRAIPRGPSQRHEAARPAGARASGLRAAIIERACFDPGELGFWPDHFEVDVLVATITLYEVVVTHNLDAGKLKKLRALCDITECRGWRVRLLVAGRDGEYVEHDPRTGRMTDAARAAVVAALGGSS